jgi:hypothetical protein
LLDVVTIAPLSGCTALDTAIEGVVIINFPDDRN